MERQKIVDKGTKILELFMQGGYDLQQVYQQYAILDEYAAVFKKIAGHLNPPSNVHLNRFKFREIQQANGETFDEYVNKARIVPYKSELLDTEFIPQRKIKKFKKYMKLQSSKEASADPRLLIRKRSPLPEYNTTLI